MTMANNLNSTDPTPRRVVAEIVLSLDGRVNGVGGDYDMSWIVPHAVSESSRERTAGFTRSATTAVLGRKNYEGFAGYWPPVADDESADPRDRVFSRWFTTVDKVVFSTTLRDAGLPNTTVTAHSPSEVVAGLRNQAGGDIIVLASSSIIRQLLDADQVDRLSIMLCPETVGGGDRLFDDSVLQRAEWTLSSHTVTETGAIVLDYDRRR
jgi:dihydrofolate reductase